MARRERKSLASLRSGPSPSGLLQPLKWTRQLLSKGSLPSCSHKLDQLLAVRLRLAEKLRGGQLLRLLVLKLRGAQQPRLLVLRLKGVLLLLLPLKLLVLRPRDVLLLKLQLLLPQLLPVQTVSTSLGTGVTTFECRPLTLRLSIKFEDGDFPRRSEECDILPTTNDSMTIGLRRRPA